MKRGGLVVAGVAAAAVALLASRRSSSSSTPSPPPPPPPPPRPPVPTPVGPVVMPRPPEEGPARRLCRPPSPAPPAYPFPGRERVLALQEAPGQVSPRERDAELVAWLEQGVLDPIRWVPIPMPRNPALVVRVPADALSMGGVRLCGSMVAAQRIADRLGMLLPTAGIIAARYAAAAVKIGRWPMGHALPPQRPGGPAGWCNPGGGVLAWLDEQDGIEQLLEEGGGRARAGILDTTGKDYVLGPYVVQHPDRCSIFGWYGLDGLPQQSPATGGGGGHELAYFDYSHRIMLVHRTAHYNQLEVDLARVYEERPELVSYSGLPERIPARHPGIPRVV